MMPDARSPACGNRLLRALPEEERRLLDSRLEMVTAPRGRVLFEAEGEVEHAYFPDDAVVAVLASLNEGSEVEAATIGREGLVGFVAVMCSRHAFGRAVVQVGGQLQRVPHGWLQELVYERPATRQLLLCYFEALLSQVMQSVVCNAVHDVSSRMSRWLLTMQDRIEGDELELTHEFLAQMLAVQRPTVSLAIRLLHEAGLVESRRGRVRVLNRAGLEEASCECYRVVRRHFERLLPLTYR
jgi:CRP-like cAMP-binding protein